jgi:hypothetical protein
MNFDYQFEVKFIFKNNSLSRHIICNTYTGALNGDFYLHHLVGGIIDYYQFRRMDELDKRIDEIKQGKYANVDNYMFSDEGGVGALLLIGERVRIIDLIHSDDGYIDGMKGSINYNITTPIEFQYFEIAFLLKLLEEWKKFIIEQNQMVYVPLGCVRDNYITSVSQFNS